jgi:hypothetical protein
MAIAIVAGAVANKPCNGGEAWVRLSWIIGLRRLGFDVYFVEVLGASGCVDRDGRSAPYGESINRSHLEPMLGDFGLTETTALLDERGERLYGLDAQELGEVAAEAEVLFDLSGHLGDLPIAARSRRRVYVDLDPGFTQAWHADPSLPFRLSGYDHYVTVGLNLGKVGCTIPVAGVEWIPTLPPIVLDEWACAPTTRGACRFTTVATWRSHFGPIEIDGSTLGLKHHEFRRVIDLPERVADAQFELALDIHPADATDRRELEAHGWRIVSSREVAATPREFRDYVRGSGAEFSVAQPVYAQTGSGWFSDRTAAYLAVGRPALVQETGIGSFLPVGEGLLTFASPSEARVQAQRIAADPVSHAQAARQLAEGYLDSDIVLGGLLVALGLDCP